MTKTPDGSEQHLPVIIDDPVGGRGPWWALIVVCFAEFMVILDATIVNVALPTIQGDLHISSANLQWVINSYTLAFGGLLLLGGRMSDLLGRRRIFVIGTLIFSAASLLNGLAWNPESLIFFRGLQGAGAALISPAALSVIMTSFSEGSQRSKAMGVWSAIASGGAAVGLLLGGVITQKFDWEWIFYINVPIGLAVIVAAYRWVPESHADLGHRRFDIAGAISVTAGLMLLVYSIVGTVEHGFMSTRSLGLFAVAIGLLVAFVLIERRTAAPLVRLSLLRLRSLAVANSTMLIISAGMFAFFYFATLYLQLVLQFDPIETGMAFLPFAVGTAIGAGTAGGLIARCGVRLAGFISLGTAASGLVLMAATLAVDGTYWWMLAGMIPMSIGMGWAFVLFTLIATTNIADDEAGLASGVFNTSQQIGGAIGLAVLSTVYVEKVNTKLAAADATPVPVELLGSLNPQELLQQLSANVAGYQTAFYAGGGLMVAGLLIHVLFLRRRDVTHLNFTDQPDS